MANKTISELTEATSVNEQDLFVLEQSGLAKKMTAETFITAQNLITALATALSGHGGISSVALASTSGRIRTYRMTFTDGTSTTFQVYDGTTIERIARTSTAGLVDTYTIFMNDGTTTFFTVTNGADGDVSSATLSSELAKKAPVIKETTATSAIATFADGADNMPMQNVIAEIDPVQDLTYGDPYPAGGGKNLLNNTASSMTQYGVTFTVNTDGSVTVSGTATETARLNLGQLPVRQDETYTISGSLSAYSSNQAQLFCESTAAFPAGHRLQSYSGRSITSTALADETITVRLYVYNGTSVSGTFYPQVELGSTATSYAPYSNICPITGHTEVNVYRTGKNLFPTATMTLGNGNPRTAEVYFAKPLPIGTYTFSASVTTNTTASDTAGVQFITTSGVIGYATMAVGTTGTLTKTITVTKPLRNLYFSINTTDYNNGKTVVFENIQVEYGSSATAYEEYTTPTTTTLSWQTEAGTVYGGTIDVATGLLTVNMATVDLGTLNWRYNSGNNRFDTQIPNASMTPRGYVVANAICSTYKTVAFSYLYAGQDKCLAFDQNNLRIRDTAYSDAALFKTAMNGVQLVYELATAQTYQLTGQQLMTLLGSNNVWSDLGDVTVTYPADTKLYIEKLTQPTEDDLVANQAITSGQYFMIGNSLYLALANIASGAAITIGTNAQRVSLADALNNINS